jgi:biotin transport system substrate-specific component
LTKRKFEIILKGIFLRSVRMQTMKHMSWVGYWLQDKSQTQQLLLKVFLAVMGTVLLAVSAKVQVPFWPVNLTMNNAMALTIGFVYGPALGASTLFLYIAEGIIGLPVFSGGVGLAYFTGPAMGYLVGYFLSAGLMGVLAHKGWNQKFVNILMAYTVSWILLYGCALLGLMRFMPLEKAFVVGVVPFMFGDMVIKTLFFSLIIYKFYPKTFK